MALDEILGRKEPILYLVTAEESRVEEAIQHYCEDASTPMPLFRWSSTQGMEKVQGGVVQPVSVPEHSDQRTQAASPLVAVLRYAAVDCDTDGIFLFKDIHHYLRGSPSSLNLPAALTTRALRDAFYQLRATGKPRKIVLLSSEQVVPPDLEKEVRVCEFPLPTREELMNTVQSSLRRAQAIRQKTTDFTYEVTDSDALASKLINAAVGLTQIELEYFFDNLFYLKRCFTDTSPQHLIREKQQIIRKSGVLEFIPAEDLENLEVGGLDALLHWLRLRKHVFDNRDLASKEYGISQVPRGVLLAGISGCGKSLVCKRIASEWGLPLLRLDMGAIFDRFVGASEERIRRALQVAESIAPCILWIDEIEKGFSASSGGDGGTSSRVLGTFLVWMQEKKAPVFIAASANDITALPPELLRPGRFDNRFFVGCPGDNARREIFRIHLQTRRLNPDSFNLDRLVEITFGYTGAEIEQVVLDSTYDAFYEERRATTDDLVRNIQRSRPLVKSLGRQMERILEMLENGRMELASEDTLLVDQLVEVLQIEITR